MKSHRCKDRIKSQYKSKDFWCLSDIFHVTLRKTKRKGSAFKYLWEETFKPKWKRHKSQQKILIPISTSKKKLYLHIHFAWKTTENQFTYMLPIMEWMLTSPQDSCVEILTPRVMVLGGGAFGRFTDHGGGSSWMDWVTLESPLTLSTIMRTQGEGGLLWAKKQAPSPDSQSGRALILDFSSPEMWEINKPPCLRQSGPASWTLANMWLLRSHPIFTIVERKAEHR